MTTLLVTQNIHNIASIEVEKVDELYEGCWTRKINFFDEAGNYGEICFFTYKEGGLEMKEKEIQAASKPPDENDIL